MREYKHGISNIHLELKRYYEYIAGDAWFDVIKPITRRLFAKEPESLGDLAESQVKILINIALKEYPELVKSKVYEAQNGVVKIDKIDKEIIVKDGEKEYKLKKEDIDTIIKMGGGILKGKLLTIPIEVIKHLSEK